MSTLPILNGLVTKFAPYAVDDCSIAMSSMTVGSNKDGISSEPSCNSSDRLHRVNGQGVRLEAHAAALMSRLYWLTTTDNVLEIKISECPFG